MRQCLTAVVERNAIWDGDFATEPWETGWAAEAIFFVRILSAQHETSSPAEPILTGRVQISPDGMEWMDEGTRLHLAAGQPIGFVRVSHFGGWLRLTGATAAGVRLRVVAYLTLKE